MGLLLRSGRLLLGAAIGAGATACYSAGSGTAPPTNNFYFPVGLATQATPPTVAGQIAEPSALFVVNSDFDLQFNGGTLQGYDLATLRSDAAALVTANLQGTMLPLCSSSTMPGCLHSTFLAPLNCGGPDGPGSAAPLGGVQPTQSCAPAVDPSPYLRQSVIIGAFATDLQISVATTDAGQSRLFLPVRGDSSVTWADVVPGQPDSIDCGQQGTPDQDSADNRCGANHRAGSPTDEGNTRALQMPGEPFGMAQTEDGRALAVTHQSDTKTSLVLTGLDPLPEEFTTPNMQFVLDGMPLGGMGLAAVPHETDSSVPPCDPMGLLPAGQTSCVKPAFLETNRTTAELDLLRYYSDDRSSLHRPFLQREAVFPIISNAVGTDSRGIVIDRTPRIACRARNPGNPACAELGARVFFASRTPPALGIAEVGGPPPEGAGDYNPDQVVYKGNVNLLPGPSNVYLAPIVDRDGNYALRVFVVLFDSSQIAVYDPNNPQLSPDFISVGEGPFAMAFDPFSMDDVGAGNPVPIDPVTGSRPYRFAYVANFTQSYLQMIDLDNSQPSGQTFQSVVFTLGLPTNPKGQ